MIFRIKSRFIKSKGYPINENLTVENSENVVFDSAKLGNWYHPVMIGPGTLGSLATNPTCLRQAIKVINLLGPDDYILYLQAYYQAGLERFGDSWRYADIITVLQAAVQLLRPKNYLEIGVRRGRSMAIVASGSPDCEIFGFDLWGEEYAGMKNPGPDFVRAELTKLGYIGKLKFIAGNSHETVPHFLTVNPDLFFDLITVDGDHSENGAKQDLLCVLPRLKIGGVLVFDDITHPSHPYLMDVWHQVLSDPRFTKWEYTDLGYGVAFAIRRYA